MATGTDPGSSSPDRDTGQDEESPTRAGSRLRGIVLPRRPLTALLVAFLGGAPLALAGCGGTTASIGSESPTTTPGVTLSTERSPGGRIVATGSGHTLYDFALDKPGHSACISPTCVGLWPPLVVATTPTVAGGLRPSLVGTIRRPDGSVQVTYGGHPLYTWIGDTQPGMVSGQGLNNEGGLWYVIAPSGRQLTTGFSVTS